MGKDKIIYTGKSSKEEIAKKLNELISEFLREKEREKRELNE